MADSFSKSAIVELLQAQGEDEKRLLEAADAAREAAVGNDVHLRGLVEFSNICRNDCLYCGLRRSNKSLKRYRLEPAEIVELATKAVKNYGFKTIVMQSGEDPYYDLPKMEFIIKSIKDLGAALTLSLGERPREEFARWKDFGADRYLMRIETTDRDLYHRLNPKMSWENRHRCLMDLKDLGFELGSGIMVGLPGQSLESIADDLLYLKQIGVDMAGIGPFIPHPETPLADAPKEGNFKLALKTMAVMRLMLPEINIPATTAMESLHPNGRILALKSGANVVMPNITEGEYRKLYELYPGKICVNDTPLHCRTCIGLKIEAIGRSIGSTQGSSLSFRGQG